MYSDNRLNPTVKLELTNNPTSAARRFLLSADSRNFYVDATVAYIVTALQSNQDPDSIFEQAAEKFGIKRDAYDKLIGTQLPAMGVLVSSRPVEGAWSPSSNPESITFLFPVMSRLLAKKISGQAAAFFSKRVVVGIFTVMLLILANAFLTNSINYTNISHLLSLPENFKALQYGQLFLIIFTAAVIHELGHLAAAQRFNCEIDRINVGLYLIFPVFYVNMSNTWKLSTSQRIIVNLGGVYFQFIFTMLLLFTAQYTSSELMSYAVYVSLYLILLNLNPFLKFDGYWVYGDYFDIINLRKQHLKLLGSFMHTSPRHWLGMYVAIWRSNAGLAAYVVGGTIFLAYFSYLVIQLLVECLIQLPRKFMELTDAVLHSATIGMSIDAVANMAYQFFLICAFLLILRRFILFGVSAWKHGGAGANYV
jgi:hypothetical protein